MRAAERARLLAEQTGTVVRKPDAADDKQK